MSIQARAVEGLFAGPTIGPFGEGTAFSVFWEPARDSYTFCLMTRRDGGSIYTTQRLPFHQFSHYQTTKGAVAEALRRTCLHLQQAHWFHLAYSRGGYA